MERRSLVKRIVSLLVPLVVVGCTEEQPIVSEPDTVPPAAIENLHVGNETDTSLTLYWYYPLRPPLTEYPTEYKIYRSEVVTDLLTPGGRARADSWTYIPLDPSEGQMTIEGESGKQYYFVMRGVDAAGNWSELSNVAEGRIFQPRARALFSLNTTERIHDIGVSRDNDRLYAFAEDFVYSWALRGDVPGEELEAFQMIDGWYVSSSVGDRVGVISHSDIRVYTEYTDYGEVTLQWDIGPRWPDVIIKWGANAETRFFMWVDGRVQLFDGDGVWIEDWDADVLGYGGRTIQLVYGNDREPLLAVFDPSGWPEAHVREITPSGAYRTEYTVHLGDDKSIVYFLSQDGRKIYVQADQQLRRYDVQLDRLETQWRIPEHVNDAYLVRILATHDRVCVLWGKDESSIIQVYRRVRP